MVKESIGGLLSPGLALIFCRPGKASFQNLEALCDTGGTCLYLVDEDETVSKPPITLSSDFKVRKIDHKLCS